MKQPKKNLVRSARKLSHVTNKALHKALHFTTRVEAKTNRILSGTDSKIQIEKTQPLEKIYYEAYPEITPINPAMPAVGRKPSVVLFLPTLHSGSFFGGIATALVVAAKMALVKKYDLLIVQTLKTGKKIDLAPFFAREGVDIKQLNIEIMSVADRKYNFYGYINMLPDDIFLASAWWDAYLINQLPLNKNFIYLIQDFEPIFYNNSDTYVLAESTYKLNNFIPLCNTKLMYDFMADRKYPAFSKNAGYWFEPAVTRKRADLPNSLSKKKLFLYGRPDVHRNLFYTALNSIDYALKAGFLKKEDWEFYMAGQDNLPDIHLTAGVDIINLGKMTMEKYIDFSQSVNLTISPMMAPHPNYPTLELSSLGSMVVTTKYANKQDLSNYSENIVMCDTDVESMAGAIKEAVLRIPQTSPNSQLPPSWNESLDQSIKAIIEQLN